MSRAMAVLLASTATVLALIVPLGHGMLFIVGMIAAGAAAGRSAYAGSTPDKKSPRSTGEHPKRTYYLESTLTSFITFVPFEKF
jgi:hypothetical protein